MSTDANTADATGADKELTPIFSSSNDEEMDRISALFKKKGIHFMIGRREASGFWSALSKRDDIRVYVEPSEVDEATALIQRAVADEAIAGDGDFIDAEQRRELKRTQRQIKKEKKEAKREEKVAERAEKQAEREEKKALKQAKKDERNRKKAERLEQQAEDLEDKAKGKEEKAREQRDKAKKKRDKADKKRS